MKNYQGPNLEQLFKDVCIVFDESACDVRGKCRKANLCVVRCVFCYVAYLYTTISIRDISKTLGDRDHTTALHQRDLAIDLLSSNNTDFVEKFEIYKQNSLYFKHMTVLRMPRKFNVHE